MFVCLCQKTTSIPSSVLEFLLSRALAIVPLRCRKFPSVLTLQIYNAIPLFSKNGNL